VKRTAWTRAALVVAATPVAGLALAALAPSGWWMAGLARHWAPQLALLSLPLWCWLGRRPAIGLTLLLITGTALWPTLRAAHANQAPAPGSAAISATTANLYYHSLQHAEAIARLDGELVVLIETRPEDRALVARDPRWPHQHWQQPPNGGIALLSRFPMKAKDFELEEAYGISARVELPWGPTRVLCLHTWSPRGAHTAAGNQLQLVRLAGLADSMPGPVLILGDLNASPADPGIAYLRRTGLLVPHGGEVRTWPSWLGPFGIAIDHVLGRGLALGGANAIDLPGSDHHAVQVRVSGGATAHPPHDGPHAPTATSPP
jgi:endonuclease/exonuclease/phosphatase (EEP) superfamily protein YafD